MSKAYPVTHSEAEWRRLLTPETNERMRDGTLSGRAVITPNG